MTTNKDDNITIYETLNKVQSNYVIISSTQIILFGRILYYRLV